MEADTIADTRFQEILALEGISLKDAEANYPYHELFKEGGDFPEFFNDDEPDLNRTIKQLASDVHNNLRVIYLEVFRLALEDDDDTFLVNLKRKLFSVDFQIRFTAESDDRREIFNDFQFKRFFAEFLGISQEQRNLGIEGIIKLYPLMDQVFIHILRSILVENGVEEPFNTRLETGTVFEILGKELALDINVSYPKCWKFEDADIVCYEGPEQQLYVVYTISQTQNIPQSTQKLQLHAPQEQLPVTNYEIKTLAEVTYEPAPITYTANQNAFVSYDYSSPVYQNIDNLTSKYTSDLVSGSTYTSGAGAYQTNVTDYSVPSYDTSKYDTTSYTSYSTSYQPTSTTTYVNAAESYKIDDKVNALVDKYLNTNPEDIIGQKYTTSTTSYETTNYAPSSYDTTNYLTSYKQQPLTDYKYTSSTTYDNYYTSPYSESYTTTDYKNYGNVDKITSSIGDLNLGASPAQYEYKQTTYTLPQSSSYSSYSTSSHDNYGTSYKTEYSAQSYSTSYKNN